MKKMRGEVIGCTVRGCGISARIDPSPQMTHKQAREKAIKAMKEQGCTHQGKKR